MKRPAAALLFALYASVHPATQPPAAAPSFADVEATALTELKAINAPGAAIAIVKGDRVVFAKGLGVANVETGQPMAADTIFRVGSVTKMFTAAALVSLADEGRLRLGDPISKYAAGLNGRIGRLTVHQLLSHTAGLRDEAPAYGPHDDGALASAVRGWGEDYLFTDAGRVMSYSNPGFALAGYVLEQAAKKPYADVIDERLLKPLSMSRTTFRPTIAMTLPFAQGHASPAGAPPAIVRPFADNAGFWPAGFLFASATDLARFTIAFMNDGIIEGRAVLKPSVIATMATGYADVPSSPEHARYGYGLTTSTHRGVRVVQHGGSIDGFGASVRMLPDEKTAVVVLVNRSGGQLEKTSERALELTARLQPAAPRPTARIALDASELAKYAGVYTNPPARIELIARDGRLFVRRGASESEATKIGDLRFLVAPAAPGAAGQEFALVPGADGQIAFLHLSSRAFKKLPVRSS